MADCDRHQAPHARVSIALGKGAAGGSEDAPIQVELSPALLGAGLLAAFLMRVFGLRGIALAGDTVMPFGSTLRGVGWGVLVVGVLALAAVRRDLAGSRTMRGAAACALAVGAAAFVANLALGAGAGEAVGLGDGGAWAAWAGHPFACGAVLGACIVPASIVWVSLYAQVSLWSMVLHLAGSLLVAGMLYFVGVPWTGTGAGSLTYTALLAAGSCALMLAARVPESGPGEAQPCAAHPATTPEGTVAASGVEHAPDRPRPLRDAAAFLRGQWVPLAGVCMLAFIHGLRWTSAVLGLTRVKPYDTQGWEFALGPVVALALVWFLLFRTPVRAEAPQRAACQVLIPVAAAVLLVVPVLNPLFGFYVGLDTTGPGFVALEMVLDACNETAISLLLFSALLSVAASVRVTGVSAVFAGGALAVCAAVGVLLGLYGYGVVGANGSIVCFLVWTVYLLAIGLSSLGRNKDERDSARLGQESVENFIRRTAHVLAQRHGLSQREEEILRYLARGYSYTHTAQDFYISENTVRTHAKHIYAKLGISRREELFRMFDEAGTDIDEQERDRVRA